MIKDAATVWIMVGNSAGWLRGSGRARAAIPIFVAHGVAADQTNGGMIASHYGQGHRISRSVTLSRSERIVRAPVSREAN